jgi:hypothetical protein
MPLSMMSIRLQQTELRTMLESAADLTHLINVLETMGPDIRHYKGLDPLLALMSALSSQEPRHDLASLI